MKLNLNTYDENAEVTGKAVSDIDPEILEDIVNSATEAMLMRKSGVDGCLPFSLNSLTESLTQAGLIKR